MVAVPDASLNHQIQIKISGKNRQAHDAVEVKACDLLYFAFIRTLRHSRIRVNLFAGESVTGNYWTFSGGP
jgi:hypothetical protein